MFTAPGRRVGVAFQYKLGFWWEQFSLGPGLPAVRFLDGDTDRTVSRALRNGWARRLGFALSTCPLPIHFLATLGLCVPITSQSLGGGLWSPGTGTPRLRCKSTPIDTTPIFHRGHTTARTAKPSRAACPHLVSFKLRIQMCATS